MTNIIVSNERLLTFAVGAARAQSPDTSSVSISFILAVTKGSGELKETKQM